MQYLAYSLALGSDKDVAMILPLPVASNTPEDGVQFIDLHEYPSLFTDLEKLHPPKRSKDNGSNRGAGSVDLESYRKLEVKTVGSFEASFVPKVADFARLDERFRLPENTWDQLPAYKDFGRRRDLSAGSYSRYPGAQDAPGVVSPFTCRLPGH